jgi:radical SAM protein with 4Fe4S-binding SPASM domain
MELTERCNNNCIHCYINLPADDHRAMERELTTEEIKEILKEASSLGCLTVRFTGGEPLLRDDIEELYLFARRLGLKVLIFTNATLITPHLADLFTRIPPLRKIEVSFYGMKRKSYEAVSRSPGSFDAACRGINLLLKRKVPFVVKTTLLPPNRGEKEKFKAWASTIPWMDKAPACSVLLDLRCRRDSNEKIDLIKKLRLTPEEEWTHLTSRGEEYIGEMREFCTRFTRPPREQLFTCGAGTGGGCVDAYGQLQLCMMLRHPATVYNLKKGSFKDAMENFFPTVKIIKAINSDYLSRCAKCFLNGLCEQCPAKSWTEHGTLDSPVEYFCEFAHAEARYLGLLQKNEKAWEITNWKERLERFSRGTTQEVSE